MKSSEMATEDSNTEELIKQAARKIFTEKGLAGARMQDIAQEAGVNKALVNYYFRSKEKLFEIVFDEAFVALYSHTAVILASDKDLFQKIEEIVENDSKIMLANPYLPIFVMNEVARNGELMKKKIASSPVKEIISKFSKQVAAEVKKGTIRKVDGEELFINLTSMIMFPFIGKGVFQILFERNEESFEKLILKRRKEIVNFIVSSIKK